MGASESKLVFKQGIFRLQEAKAIAAEDTYWTGFWELPESTEDVFTLFSATDIRRTRDTSLVNLETLVSNVSSRLFLLRSHPAFPSVGAAPEKEALNCIRVLTRIIPFVYEADSLEAWEEKFFWSVRRTRKQSPPHAGKSEVLFDDADVRGQDDDGGKDGEFEDRKPLAEELIDVLTDMLFYSGFTLPSNDQVKTKVTYSIWSSGVGCNTPIATNGRLESNRTEVLRLLLTLASKSMYMPANVLPVKGVRAITYIATCPDKQLVLSLLCSLINTTLKFNPTSWRIPYDHVVVGDPKHVYVASCIQFLLVLLLYPVPEDGRGSPKKNFFRHFLGRLHRAEDFQFICDGMSRTLHQPLSATSSYLPGSQKPVRWSPEMTMLFWETIQCNKRFRSFVIDSERGHDFMILILFYAIDYRADPTKQGIVRMCVFVLQTMSAEASFGKWLNEPFERQETLPVALRIDDWSGTYGDFLIVSIHTLVTNAQGKLDAIYPALLAIINNVAPYLERINKLSCLKMMQLYSSMSSPSFLLANETNHDLLTSILESINAIIEHRFNENPLFIMHILKHRKRFEALRGFTLESAQEEVDRLGQRRKEGPEGDEAAVQGAPRHSRQASIDSARSPTSARTHSLSDVPEEGAAAFAIGDDEDSEEELSRQEPSQSSRRGRASRTPSVSSSVDDDVVPTQLRGMSEKARGKMPASAHSFSRANSMSSIHSQPPVAPSLNGGFVPSPQWIDSWLPTLPLHTILTLLSSVPASSVKPPASLPRLIEPTPPRIHIFEWSPLSLGWYESLLWSFICSAEMVVERGTVGVWNGTAIRLFKVEKEAARGPSLMKPLGAVDAVGSSIVQRIGSLNLRGATAQGNESPSPGGGV